MVECPEYVEQEHNEMFLFTGDLWAYMQNVGIFIYGYNCITSFHYVFRQVSNRSKKRLDKISMRTMALLWLIYLPIGIIAYYSYGTLLLQKGNELFPNRPGLPGSHDLAMNIGKVLMIPTCWIVLLINLFPFKDQTFALFKINRNDCNETWVTIMALILSAIIGWLYPNVTDWFSLLGAFCGGFLNCYFPVRLFTVQFHKYPKRPWVNRFAWVWMVIMMIIL